MGCPEKRRKERYRNEVENTEESVSDGDYNTK
jgi:hypothetical protein